MNTRAVVAEDIKQTSKKISSSRREAGEYLICNAWTLDGVLHVRLLNISTGEYRMLEEKRKV